MNHHRGDSFGTRCRLPVGRHGYERGPNILNVFPEISCFFTPLKGVLKRVTAFQEQGTNRMAAIVLKLPRCYRLPGITGRVHFCHINRMRQKWLAEIERRPEPAV